EKSGRRLEAREAYSRFVAQFPEDPAGNRVRQILAAWDYAGSGPVNLRFLAGDPGELPAGWFVPAIPKDASQWAQVHRGKECLSRSCAVVMAPAMEASGASSLSQTFSAKSYAGRQVRIKAQLRLDTVEPGDRAKLWLGVERPKGTAPVLN